MLYIILLEPELSENVGFIARTMKNFDFNNLILINPRCDLDKAIKTAKWGKDVLKKAKIKDTKYLDKLDYIIGTTAKLGRDYNLPRNPINPEQLANKLSKIDLKKLRIGLIIGRESIGLTNNEINMCNILVTIPASRKYPTMNISHATAILLYELSKKINKESCISHIKFADKKDLQIITRLHNKILDDISFETKEKKETQKKVWKRVFGKALLTKREAFSIMGLFRKLTK